MNKERQHFNVLQPGNFVGMEFQEGWWFIQVLGSEFIELKPWILLNENEERDVIAAQTAGSQDDEIVDTVDRNFLIPQESEQNLVFHIQFGIAPSRMQVYPIFGRERAPNLRGTAEPGTPQVPVTGFDSPYNEPSEQMEMFIVNNQDIPSFQAFNPTDEALEARLSFHVNKLKYATVTDVNLMKAMLQGQQPFRSHMTGLGVQDADKLRVPNWLSDAFGDHILETEEILKEGDTQQSQVPTTQRVQRIGGGGQ